MAYKKFVGLSNSCFKMRTFNSKHYFLWRKERSYAFLQYLTQFTSVKGKRILDLGCGRGALSCVLAQLGAEVIAIDPGSKVLFEGRRFCLDESVYFTQGVEKLAQVYLKRVPPTIRDQFFSLNKLTVRGFHRIITSMRMEILNEQFIFRYPGKFEFNLSLLKFLPFARELCFAHRAVVIGRKK